MNSRCTYPPAFPLSSRGLIGPPIQLVPFSLLPSLGRSQLCPSWQTGNSNPSGHWANQLRLILPSVPTAHVSANLPRSTSKGRQTRQEDPSPPHCLPVTAALPSCGLAEQPPGQFHGSWSARFSLFSARQPVSLLIVLHGSQAPLRPEGRSPQWPLWAAPPSLGLLTQKVLNEYLLSE